jgi:hypothetical protein
LTAVVAACALACVLPAAGAASGTQQTIIQDDTWMIYSPPAQVLGAMEAMKSLGVNVIRVSVVWSLVAPDPNSAQPPANFDATVPSDYPPGAWDRYQLLVGLAHGLGMQVYFQLTAPAPLWATPPQPLNQGYRWSHDPNAAEFGQFAEAVGREFAGQVNYWSIWNEPNIGGWMTPQWNTLKNGRKVQASPAIYRAMLDDAWSGLQAAGQGHETILVGETAAYGFSWKGYGADMSPITFVQALYCVSASYKPLTGAAATEIGCPKSGNRNAFRRAHPALFDATGWAHHPYDFNHPPGFHLKDPGAADLVDLPRLEHALNRAQTAYGSHRKLPLYLTEWGYQSDPPDPFVHFSEAQQADYLNQGEYMAWRDPRVAAFGQFLLVDSAPFTQYPAGSRAYWSSFQSGLITTGGALKPAFHAFQLPIWLPDARHGPHVPVWGQLRPANHAGLQTGTLQFLARGAHGWKEVATVRTRNSQGFFLVHVRIRSAGRLQLSWPDPSTGAVDHSREATVH